MNKRKKNVKHHDTVIDNKHLQIYLASTRVDFDCTVMVA